MAHICLFDFADQNHFEKFCCWNFVSWRRFCQRNVVRMFGFQGLGICNQTSKKFLCVLAPVVFQRIDVIAKPGACQPRKYVAEVSSMGALTKILTGVQVS